MKLDYYATGNRLRIARTKRGLKQHMVAEMLDLTPTMISRWECGIAMPKLWLLVELADIYGVDLASLIVTKEKR